MSDPSTATAALPPIGMTVRRRTQDGWRWDWVALVRIGDEQGVAVWGAAWPQQDRFSPTDEWARP